MRKIKTVLVLSFVSLFFFSFVQSDVTIKGWFKAGNLPESYKMGIDTKVAKNGNQSAFIESTADKIDGFTTIMQSFNAKNYLGTKVKLTGYIKPENVTDWSGMWMRVDSRKVQESLSFDNMQDRPVTGTTDWIKCEITLDVPEESGAISFGALISGTGKIWFDNVTFEILDNATPIVVKDFPEFRIPEKPVNLNFED